METTIFRPTDGASTCTYPKAAVGAALTEAAGRLAEAIRGVGLLAKATGTVVLFLCFLVFAAWGGTSRAGAIVHSNAISRCFIFFRFLMR